MKSETVSGLERNSLRNLVVGFAIGDALGEIFEFYSPSEDDINKRWHQDRLIQVTDDTLLLLSSVWALTQSKNDISWPQMTASTCDYLMGWFNTGALRGIGTTTYNALKQMQAHSESAGDWNSFRIASRGYNSEMSAGNGILSRALPLLASRIAVDTRFGNWLKLTHLHPDGHRAVDDLASYLRDGQSPSSGLAPDGKGFYAPDTLSIAVRANTDATSSFEVFSKSQVEDGDNDSTAALALGLWCFRNGIDKECERIAARIVPEDLALLEQSLMGVQLSEIFR